MRLVLGLLVAPLILASAVSTQVGFMGNCGVVTPQPPNQMLLALKPPARPLSEREIGRVTFNLNNLRRRTGREIWSCFRPTFYDPRRLLQQVTDWLSAADAIGGSPEIRQALTAAYVAADTILRERIAEAEQLLLDPSPDITAVELKERYRAAADGMRVETADHNPDLAAWRARMQLYLEMAADALQMRAWEQARANIERAETELDRFPAAGR